MKTYTLTKDEENNKNVLKQINEACEAFIYFAQCNGYEVYYPFVKENGYLELELVPNDLVEYLPRIYISNRNKLLNQDELAVEIQTTSYGALNQKEFEKFLEGQQNGMRVAAEIKKLYKEGYFPTVICN
jgi:hypothetical protein